MTENSDGSIDESSVLKKRIAELENIVSELQKPTIRHEDHWLPRLTPILTILGLIQTLFIAAGIAYGLLGVSNMQSITNERNKIIEITREVEKIKSQAKIEYENQLDSLRIAQQISRNVIGSAHFTKKSIDNTYTEVTSIESKLHSTLTQAEQDQGKLKLSVDREIDILKNKISKIDTNIVNLAKVFSSAAIRGEKLGFVNESQTAFLYFLSTVLYEISGLPVDNDGLHYYNLAATLTNIGKYEIAIKAFNECLRRQPKLPEDKKTQIRQHIQSCENKIEERQKLLSKETKPVMDPNKLTLSILQALDNSGIFDKSQIEEILKKSALENK